MDFKALSRTAEADVQALASAARQRQVWKPVDSVGLAEACRFRSCLRIAPQAVGLRTPARELFYVLQKPVSMHSRGTERERDLRVNRRKDVPWISEGVRCSRLGKMPGGRTQERFVVSPLLNGDQHPWLPDRAAHPDCSQPKNPCAPSRLKPSPTAAERSEVPQLQLPPHAIPTAAGRLLR